MAIAHLLIVVTAVALTNVQPHGLNFHWVRPTAYVVYLGAIHGCESLGQSEDDDGNHWGATFFWPNLLSHWIGQSLCTHFVQVAPSDGLGSSFKIVHSRRAAVSASQVFKCPVSSIPVLRALSLFVVINNSPSEKRWSTFGLWWHPVMSFILLYYRAELITWNDCQHLDPRNTIQPLIANDWYSASWYQQTRWWCYRQGDGCYLHLYVVVRFIEFGESQSRKYMMVKIKGDSGFGARKVGPFWFMAKEGKYC